MKRQQALRRTNTFVGAAARHLRVPGIVLLLGAGVLLGADGLNIVRPAALAAHPTDLPANPGRTRLDLAAAVLGLGGASCGPIPIEHDIVKAGAVRHFGFVIRPLGAKADAAELARARPASSNR
ncbi:MAG TPA: hypothetical protein VHU81_19515 [Thermoanaerobaculia bacterium]|nr:hypothetical protein [Thermoanaerobaculia bacterium]